jgi:flavin reductase (DIM6/NTAB) family NADH-FMN oxidoreductase RutF
MSESNAFKKVSPFEISGNPFDMLNNDWMLITAGDIKGFNMMTASWGGFGILWGKPVAYCVIRPQRYTYQFMEKGDRYTLSFYDDEHRAALNLCGEASGRDIDKVKKTGLTPVAGEHGGVYFSEARLVMECVKIYWNDLDPKNFIDPSIAGNYKDHDYHRLYVGEIKNCLVRK